MKKMLLMVLSALLLFGCAQQTQPYATPSPTATPPSASIAPAAQTVSIDISGYAFNPADTTVNKGTTVEWTNNDSVPHTITSDGGAFDSGLIQPGMKWSRTFADAGDYSYHCSVHTSMKGKVTVT